MANGIIILQNSELGYFKYICWEGSAVGCVSHGTCLFFDLLQHGLEMINDHPSLCLPLSLLLWEQYLEKPVIQPAGDLEE